MDHIIWLIDVMKNALSIHPGSVVWVSTFLLGENASIAAFALSAQGYIHPVKAIIFVFLGSMAADVFWFFMTEYVIRKRYEKRILDKVEHDETQKFIISLIDKHFFWILIFIKFLMGMRLILTIYIVLKNRIPFHRKVLLDAIGTVIFLGVIFPVGWLFGKGVASAFAFEQNFIWFISLVVFIILFATLAPKLAVFVFKKWFKDEKHLDNK